MSKRFTMQDLAEAGYIMGLATIGEVATHMELHYDAYFSIENFDYERANFEEMVAGHENESIFKYLTEEVKAKMDDELEKAFAQADAMKSDPLAEWPAPGPEDSC